MLDPHSLRNELDNVAASLSKRNMTLDTNEIQKLEEQRKSIQMKTEELQLIKQLNIYRI